MQNDLAYNQSNNNNDMTEEKDIKDYYHPGISSYF